MVTVFLKLLIIVFNTFPKLTVLEINLSLKVSGGNTRFSSQDILYDINRKVTSKCNSEKNIFFRSRDESRGCV